MSAAISTTAGARRLYGDGIMAVFGAPIDSRTTRIGAARRTEMLGPGWRINCTLRDEVWRGFRMGVGLNSGT